MFQGRTAPEPTSQPVVRKVTPHQVKAAQIAIKGMERQGTSVPPGLRRIANARRGVPQTPASSSA